MEEDGVSNPLPPPPRPGRGGGHSDAEAARLANLSNDDFRRMVMDTPRRGERKKGLKSHVRKKDGEEGERHRKPYRPKPKEGQEEVDEGQKYRDRAKERREDQNPDYVGPTMDFGRLNAVAPPGTIDIHTSDLYKISIENSKFLGGDVEHTHLVKGLDYALLNKVRSELDKKPDDDDDDEEGRGQKEAIEAQKAAAKAAAKQEDALSFRTSAGKSVYQWLVKPFKITKANEMFLPRRTAFLFDLDEEFANEIPTTIHRSKADCPPPEDCINASVDTAVLERISKIMAYLKMGSAGKNHKKGKKKDKHERKPHSIVTLAGEEIFHLDEEGAPETPSGDTPKEVPDKNANGTSKPRDPDDDIFGDAGKDYVCQVPETPATKPAPAEQQPPRPYFNDAPPEQAPPPHPPQQPAGEMGPMQGPAMPPGGGYTEQGGWQGYPEAEQYAQWGQQGGFPPEVQYQGYLEAAGEEEQVALGGLTQDQKDKGMASVFKRDDERLFGKREGKDDREKDPGFVSDTYAECYPGYAEFNREVLEESDEEGDLSKMDLGAKAKGRLHRWDFETEEEWEKYNGTKEAMPKAAYQFGVKMADGRKTRKTQSKEQKLNNELHQITKMIDKNKKEGTKFVSYGEEGGEQASKRAKFDY